MKFRNNGTQFSPHWGNYLAISLLTGFCWTSFLPSATVAQTLNHPTKDIEIARLWIKEELYFGRALPNGSMVSDEQWREFVEEEISPRFPDGFSVVDVSGYYRNTREATKLLIILHQNTPEVEKMLVDIIKTYKQRFQQESVLRIRDRVRVQF
ncbi:MAG: DUF3574 domain-containing protein [Spirulina sp.]